MSKPIVFDLGGTLMEYIGMPLNWNNYYAYGFEKANVVKIKNLCPTHTKELPLYR